MIVENQVQVLEGILKNLLVFKTSMQISSETDGNFLILAIPLEDLVSCLAHSRLKEIRDI